MPPLAFLVKTRARRIIAATVCILLALYTVVGFFVLPHYIKKIAVQQISEQTGRKTGIRAVKVNPFALSAAVQGFELKEADGTAPFIAFEELYVNVGLMSIVRGGPVLSEVRLVKPRIAVARTGENAYNFSDILARFAGAMVKSEATNTSAKVQKAVPEKTGKPLHFSVNNIQIIDGGITFDDQPAATKHEIVQLNFTIPFISNLPSYIDSFVQPHLSAVVNGTPVNIKGASKVFADSHETSLDIALQDIDIPHYLAYAPATLRVKVPSGKLDVHMKVAYRQYANRAPLLTLTGETTLRNLRMMTAHPQEEFLALPVLSIKDVSVDLHDRKIEIGSVTTGKGRLFVSRLKDGRVNLATLMTGSQPSTGPAVPASPAKEAPKAKPDAPFIVSLKSLVVDDYAVKVSDLVPAQLFGITVDRIGLDAKNISTELNSAGTITLAMRIGTGALSINGKLGIAPLNADLAVSLKDLSLKPLQPYIAERAKVILANGLFSLTSRVTASAVGADGVTAGVAGAIQVAKVSVLDGANAEDLLKWDMLSFDGIDLRTNPFALRVKNIGLHKFVTRLAISPDRKMNLKEALGTEPSVTSAETPTALPEKSASENARQETAPPDIRIDTVTLKSGAVKFMDASITPRFSSELGRINGTVTGLSSRQETAGDVDLTAKYDGYAPLSISGKVNPLSKDLFVDLKIDFKDMDLTTVSPYAGRYAGYGIEKGKLSYQMGCRIERNKLDTQNTIFIDQFTFGDAVESPEATGLPVRLAVSLLKDRNGEIHIDLPVTGELNDPQFSIGGIVVKVIVNLLVKAATSPFALLGSLFSGGEEMSFAEFAPGSSTLDDGTKKKIDSLEQALNDRPALKLDLIGRVDREKDRDGMKQGLLMRRVKAQKILAQSGKLDAADSLDTVVVTPQEYPDYLKRAYKAEKFTKPRNALGFALDLPVPEMEKLMLANLQVTDDDLKTLASERVRAVHRYLLRSKRIEPERVFTIEQKADDEGAAGCKVDFKLK